VYVCVNSVWKPKRPTDRPTAIDPSTGRFVFRIDCSRRDGFDDGDEW